MTTETKKKAPSSGAGKYLLFFSSLAMMLTGLLGAVAGLYINLHEDTFLDGRWPGMAPLVSLFLAVLAIWILILGACGIFASRRAGRGVFCLFLGLITLVPPAGLTFGILLARPTDEPLLAPLVAFLSFSLLLLTLYLAGAAWNRYFRKY
ncbi:MAG: hypothetical protein ACOYA8_00255 [Clostridium sp.]|jgi:hypothetical protein